MPGSLGRQRRSGVKAEGVGSNIVRPKDLKEGGGSPSSCILKLPRGTCRSWEANRGTSTAGAHREGASKYSVPLMMTRCAGVFTPHASVLVATSTCITGHHRRLFDSGQPRMYTACDSGHARNFQCMAERGWFSQHQVHCGIQDTFSLAERPAWEMPNLDLAGHEEVLHCRAVALVEARVVQPDAELQGVPQLGVLRRSRGLAIGKRHSSSLKWVPGSWARRKHASGGRISLVGALGTDG